MNGLSGKVLITGGAGFLGRAIIASALREEWPASFTVFSRDDHKHALLKREFPDVRCIRGDVAADRDYLAAAMAGHDIVIHAAANKHVDLSEYNVQETIRVNVIGSIQVMQAATRAGVRQLIGISTDKACHSVNVYGMTKALMERAFTSEGHHVVRYGNVIGSTGSVVTVWREMLERQGYIDSTTPDMVRFWLTADQAVSLIVNTLTSYAPGLIAIPKLAAMQMGDMAKALFPGEEFRYHGTRPGEKKYEELLTDEELPWTEEWPDVFLLHPMTGKPLTNGKQPDSGYYSYNPVHWLTPDEIREMAGIPANPSGTVVGEKVAA